MRIVPVEGPVAGCLEHPTKASVASEARTQTPRDHVRMIVHLSSWLRSMGAERGWRRGVRPTWSFVHPKDQAAAGRVASAFVIPSTGTPGAGSGRDRGRRAT